jgi:hypothetical protein
LTKIILFIKYLFIYLRFRLKLLKGQLARDEIPLIKYSTPFSPILFQLKIKKEKIQKPNNYLKNTFKFKENIKIFIKILNKNFSLGVNTRLK